VTICFVNRLDPQNVGIEGMRKWGRRFQIRQKTRENCQKCIDASKCTKGLVWSELHIKKQLGKLIATLQGARLCIFYDELNENIYFLH
jgi:hypothetical protein